MIEGIKNIFKKYTREPVKVLETNNAISGSDYSANQRKLRTAFPTYNPQLKTQNAQQKYTKLQTMAIAREVVTNEPSMVSALRTIRNAVVGNGWSLSLSPMYEALGLSFEEAYDWVNMVEDMFNTYANSPDCHFDASRQMTFNQMIATGVNSLLVNGDLYGVMRWKKSTNGLYTCVNVLDPARVQTPTARINDATIKNGIEIDIYGEPLKYYVINSDFKQDFTSGLLSETTEFKMVNHRTPLGRPIMLHAFDVLAPEQATGSSVFHSGVYYLKLISEYLSNENQRMALQASIAMVLESNEDYDKIMGTVMGKDTKPLPTPIDGADPVDYYNHVNDFCELKSDHINHIFSKFSSDRGSKMIHLLPNEQLKMLTKGDNINSIDGFTKVTNKLVSASVGSDYHATYQDYSDVSYSASRFSLAQAQLYFDWIKGVIEKKFAMPLVHCFVEEAIDKGIIPLPRGVSNFQLAKDFLLNGRFISAGKPVIDPLKEAKAETESINNGTMSKEDICSRRGVRYADVAKTRAMEIKMEKKLGIYIEPKNSESTVGESLGDSDA
jgi:lambda family phage portal protein